MPVEMPGWADKALSARRRPRAAPASLVNKSNSGSDPADALSSVLAEPVKVESVSSYPVPKFNRFITVMRDLDKDFSNNKSPKV